MKQQILSLSKKLISIASTSDNPEALKEVIDIAKEELQGFTIQEFERNGKPSILVSNRDKKIKHFKIILNAHLDVVPGKEEQFRPLIKGDKLYGRGIYDMKSGGVVMILLFKELAKKVNYPLALQVVTDEEIGGMDGTKYQIEKGITADFVIAGENTGMEIRNKSKSPFWIKLHAKGKAFHAAYVWSGDNALLKLQNALLKFYKEFPIPKKMSWVTTMNLARIETSNTAFNRIPDEAVAWLDFRVIPEEQETVEKKIKKLLPKDIEIEIVERSTPAFTDPNNIYIITLQKEVKKIKYALGEITGGNGASDIRFYNDVGIAGVEFGPLGGNHHADDEWVDIQSLEDYYNILKNFLLSI